MEPHPLDMRIIERLVSSIFPSARAQVEQVTEGMSTYIYRITYEHEIFYLRILPEEGASFAPEVMVHSLLRQQHVNVPDVIYFEHYYEPLQHSVMVTTAIKGYPVSQGVDGQVLSQILREVGKDLACINNIVVDGFGWMKRDQAEISHLQAEWPTHQAFVLEHWKSDLTFLAKTVLSPRETIVLEQMLSQYAPWLEVEQGHLTHGDLDTTHIYHDNGHYTGIIDFGGIRGASRWYDLGHFHMRDGEYLPYQGLPALLQGYADVIPLPADYAQQIRFASLLINVRTLSRSLQKCPLNIYTQHQLETLRSDITALQATQNI